MVLLFLRFHVTSQAAIWVVNVSGSFALGLLLSLALSRTAIPPSMQLLAGVGFLGSYTTFSTLMWDTFSLAQTGSVLMAFLNLYQFHLIESCIRLPFLSSSNATVIHGAVRSNWY